MYVVAIEDRLELRPLCLHAHSSGQCRKAICINGGRLTGTPQDECRDSV